MNIDELLKQQAEWAEKMKGLTLDIISNRAGTTPEEAGLGEMGGVDERIRELEARRDAMLRAFEAAIAQERSQPAQSSAGRSPSRLGRAASKAGRAAPKRQVPK